MNIFPYFNLSPQGDGNLQALTALLRMISFQLIPARGRKPQLSKVDELLLEISTYPRKGTETKYLRGLIQFARKFQLIPARGRKRRIGFCNHLFDHITTSPRKGAKNSASKMVRSFSFACLNFSVFVGFFSMNRAAAAFSLPWLLYCDKMCYNRAKSKHFS